MIGSLVITLREGLEAALIVGILLAYLARTGQGAGVAGIWLGVALAVLTSVAVGAAIFATVGELVGPAEAVFEGTAMLVAVAMLSYMIRWMRRQARDVRGGLQRQLAAALASGSRWALTTLAFVVVVREGIETALFLTDVGGVLDSEKRIVPELTIAQSEALIARGVATGGMHAKLKAAADALRGGVRQVVIAPGAQPGVVARLLAGEAVGSRLIQEAVHG